MKKLIIAALLLLPTATFAGTSVTGVELNGGSTATVEPGETVSVKVFVTTTSNDDWESTNANWVPDGDLDGECFNTPDKLVSGSYTATFNLDAPNADGIYDIIIGAYGSNSSVNNTCSSSADDETTFADVLTVETPVVVPPPAPSPSPSPSPAPVEDEGTIEGGGYTFCHRVNFEPGDNAMCFDWYTNQLYNIKEWQRGVGLYVKVIGLLEELVALLK